MLVQCGQCTHLIVAVGQRIPPWCPKCGADTRLGTEVADPNAAGAAPASVRSSATPEADLRQEQLDKESRERFSVQNVLVGVVLTVWGFLMSGLASHDPTDRILAAHPKLVSVLNGLQLLTCVNGVVLCVSGYGIRNRKPWAYAVAVSCAVVLIVGGLLFFAAFSQIGRGRELEDGVAKVRLVRENFDLLIGLAEGGFLLYFLYRHHAGQEADRAIVG